jgi:UDP-N-acetylglucosamine 2-epimerase (non-hydrolysing)
MRPGQSLSALTARLLTQLEDLFKTHRPDIVLGHGDTTTCFATAMSSFYHQIPFFHVEAGLRTRCLHSPFPEEFNRQTIAPLAKHHFAPTIVEKQNLLHEGVSDFDITIAGSTVHDAVRLMLEKHMPTDGMREDAPLIVATLHRREASHSLFNTLTGIKAAALARPDALFVCPVHPSPLVRSTFHEVLGSLDNVSLTDPMEYPRFLSLLMRASLVVTDSGGVQEEAAFFGKKVLLARQETERLDGIQSGLVSLVGLQPENIRDSILSGLKENSVSPVIANQTGLSASEIIADKVKRFIA